MTEAELRELIAQAKDEQWEELDLAGMELDRLPPEIGELTQLKRLWLGKFDGEKREWVGNRLTALPDELWELRNLEELWIAKNRLTEIPDALCQLEKLESLDLEKNQIIEIPPALQTLKALKGLDLRGNPLNIPPEILAPKKDWERPDAQPILEYYFALRDPDETQTLYEAKLLLVGEGGSGKTSLANKLLNPDYKLKPETEDTSGCKSSDSSATTVPFC